MKQELKPLTRAEQIYENVLKAMQDADEIEGVEDPREYIELMDKIRHEAVKRFNNCVDNIRSQAEVYYRYHTEEGEE